MKHKVTAFLVGLFSAIILGTILGFSVAQVTGLFSPIVKFKLNFFDPTKFPKTKSSLIRCLKSSVDIASELPVDDWRNLTVAKKSNLTQDYFDWIILKNMSIDHLYRKYSQDEPENSIFYPAIKAGLIRQFNNLINQSMIRKRDLVCLRNIFGMKIDSKNEFNKSLSAFNANKAEKISTSIIDILF